jgi:hypothetical protein
MRVYENYEREKRNRNHFGTTCGRSRTNHKELQGQEYKWTRTLIKKEKERERRKEKLKIKTKI